MPPGTRGVLASLVASLTLVAPPAVGQPAGALQRLGLADTRPPGFSGATVDGSSLSLESLRSRFVLLNFWASWCLECRAELLVLEQLHRDYASRGLTVLALNFRWHDVPPPVTGQGPAVPGAAAPVWDLKRLWRRPAWQCRSSRQSLGVGVAPSNYGADDAASLTRRRVELFAGIPAALACLSALFVRWHWLCTADVEYRFTAQISAAAHMPGVRYRSPAQR